MVGILDEVKFWKSHEEWYRELGIPWRRGYLLHGKPGTGKTSFIRALAQELGMPVHSFNVSSLEDYTFTAAWKTMMRDAPCIALLEDIDTAFHGRKPIKDPDDQMSFGHLLNTLDGVEVPHGVLLFVTTNDLSKVDPALGGPDPDLGAAEDPERPRRPGRVDRRVEMGPLSEEGRRKMAGRILEGEGVEEATAAGADETAAQFQERCFRIALARLWGQEQVVPGPGVPPSGEPDRNSLAYLVKMAKKKLKEAKKKIEEDTGDDADEKEEEDG